MAQQIEETFAVLPDALAEFPAPGRVGIKAFDVFIVEVIQPFP